jgi:hypothetical protein
MGCFRLAKILSAAVRMTKSLGPPGGKGMTTLMGRCGQAWARAVLLAHMASKAATKVKPRERDTDARVAEAKRGMVNS